MKIMNLQFLHSVNSHQTGGRELQEETVGDTQGAALRRARVDVIFDDYEV